MLTELSHKTADVDYAGTDDAVSFKAYMNSGYFCHIGKLNLKGRDDRKRGRLVHLSLAMTAKYDHFLQK